MHYELEVTLNERYFDVRVSYEIISFFRRFNTTGECWYDFKLNKNNIDDLRKLAVTDEEIGFINQIRENETVDILEHVRF